MKLKDRVAIITGGGVGIGRAIALRFAEEGAMVVIAARTLPRMEEVAQQIRGKGGHATAIQMDVTDEAQVKSMLAQTLNIYKQVDILVNNSGIAAQVARSWEITMEDWDRVMAVNLTGPMLCTREVMKHMVERRKGNVINISSEAGLSGVPTRGPYCASKWGLIGLTNTAALEAARYNIRVNCVAPGLVEGDRITGSLKMAAEAAGRSLEEIVKAMTSRVAMRRMVTAEEIAEAVLFLASDDSSGMTGQTIRVDGGARL